MSLVHKFSGLLRLPNAVQSSAYIQPAKLPTDCDAQIYESQPMLAVGNGRVGFAIEILDNIVRYANLTTIPREDCMWIVKNPADSRSFVCAYSPISSSVHSGDSGILASNSMDINFDHCWKLLMFIAIFMHWMCVGGPLVQTSDYALVGVASYVRHLQYRDRNDMFHLQIFSNIRFYFDWMAEITALELPRCWWNTP